MWILCKAPRAPAVSDPQTARNRGPRRGAGASVGLALATLATGIWLGCSRSESSADVGAPSAEASTPAEAGPPAPAEKGPPALGLAGVRQLTFAGQRSGEGYFDPQGTRMVFQSEREPGNPFYQIYLTDLTHGETRRISPGQGKTTCAWIHPSGDRVLFASTHADPSSLEQQKAELAKRASGEQSRYSWDYDPSYELYAAPTAGGDLVKLTDARGYDAEASYSPDGEQIVFASNRHAYASPPSGEAAERFGENPSVELDLYLMNSDGSNVRRLTDTPGYDGGPFFSPDGERIIWRRFSLDGARAEVYTMRTDGSDVQQLTSLGAMSWAPFYHPSGDYAIFATNLLGFANFELYLVSTDPASKVEPVRVTDLDGFDGLPVFLPDGRHLAWSRRPGSSKDGTQIYVADWDDAKARAALGISKAWQPTVSPREIPAIDAAVTQRVRERVQKLTSAELGGRLPGTDGERAATEYVAKIFAELGLDPAGDDGSFFDPFEFTAGISLGQQNALRVTTGEGEPSEYATEADWLPLSFSQTGEVAPAGVVFVGYGIVAPEGEDGPGYDSYGGVDVGGRWVLAFRYLPDDISTERRQELSRYASLRHKAMLARDRGARGVIFVSGPRSKFKDRVVSLAFDGALAGASSVFAVSVSDAVGESIVAAGGRSLETLQSELDSGEPGGAFEIEGVRVAAQVDLEQEKASARNVVARLDVPGPEDAAPLVIGAHLDHLGLGEGGGSLARNDERSQVHPGADDNASGVAGLIEIAARLASDREQLRGRDVVFAAWSAEEIGLLGSAHFVSELDPPNPHAPPAAAPYAAYLNLDMVGRLRDAVYVQGVGSSSSWAARVESANAATQLPVVIQKDSYLPTDATSFYLKAVPILSFFTGVHEDYHTPRDTADKLSYDGIVRIVDLLEAIARPVIESDDALEYIAMDREQRGPARMSIRAFLGTIPSYGRGDVVGVLLAGVAVNGPAEAAGARADDIIVELAGRKVENIYDYTYALEALKVGEAVSMVVERDGERVSLEVTPESRD